MTTREEEMQAAQEHEDARTTQSHPRDPVAVWFDRAKAAEAEIARRDAHIEALAAEVAKTRQLLSEAAEALPFIAGPVHERIRVYRDDCQGRINRALVDAEALREDAERYRWLCDASGNEYRSLAAHHVAGRLNDPIDAALAATKREG